MHLHRGVSKYAPCKSIARTFDINQTGKAPSPPKLPLYPSLRANALLKHPPPGHPPKLSMCRSQVLHQGTVHHTQHRQHRALNMQVGYARAAPSVIILRWQDAHMLWVGCWGVTSKHALQAVWYEHAEGCRAVKAMGVMELQVCCERWQLGQTRWRKGLSLNGFKLAVCHPWLTGRNLRCSAPVLQGVWAKGLF